MGLRPSIFGLINMSFRVPKIGQLIFSAAYKNYVVQISHKRTPLQKCRDTQALPQPHANATWRYCFDSICCVESPALFAEGYTFVSFDVESLFTNVPLQRTLKIIEDRIYNKKLFKTKLKKSTLRKLIRDTCTKTVFSCNNKLYEQTDGVSMGGSLYKKL